jgi:hypothetical protein
LYYLLLFQNSAASENWKSFQMSYILHLLFFFW